MGLAPRAIHQIYQNTKFNNNNDSDGDSEEENQKVENDQIDDDVSSLPETEL